jgi:hypothetical protein
MHGCPAGDHISTAGTDALRKCSSSFQPAHELGAARLLAARFNHIILELAERGANKLEPPQWKKESFFRRFAI